MFTCTGDERFFAAVRPHSFPRADTSRSPGDGIPGWRDRSQIPLDVGSGTVAGSDRG